MLPADEKNEVQDEVCQKYVTDMMRVAQKVAYIIFLYLLLRLKIRDLCDDYVMGVFT